MNVPTFLEKLLDGARVEWLPLEEIFYLKNGYTPSKSIEEFWEEGTVPWFRMEDIRAHGRILDGSIQKISQKAIKGGKIFPKNSIIISTSATIGEHALITVDYLANQRFTCLNLKENYRSQFNIKFLFHYCFLLAQWCRKNTTISSFASVEMEGFKKFQFPIPCPDEPEKSLAIQAEIVRILDKFDLLTTELNKELTLRKKQYQYYRDKLLEFSQDKGVEWKTLGEVVHIITAPAKLKTGSYRPTGKMPIIDQGAEFIAGYTSEDVKILASDTYVIFGDHSEHIKYVDFSFIQGADGLKILKPIFNNAKYVYYAFQNFYQKQSNYKRHWSTAKNTLIPIPSLEEQGRIVEILDKFETLTHSLSEGLPREIELRQKQYAYYRDLLLDFPKRQEEVAV